MNNMASEKGVLFLIILLCVMFYLVNNVKEGFYSYFGWYKKWCPECGKRNRRSCSSCVNCGWCINDRGKGECIPGNQSGPMFRKDCLYWETENPYYGYPMNHIYPRYRVGDIYPHYRYNIRYGRKHNFRW
jgi:hypothetical protein